MPTVAEILAQANRDVSLIGTVTTGDGIDWINRCSREISPFARKTTEGALALYTTARYYALPSNFMSIVEIVTSGSGTTGSEDLPFDEGYKIRGTSLGNTLIFDSLPSATGDKVMRYYRTLLPVTSTTDSLELDTDLCDIYNAYVNWHFMEQQDEGILADKWHGRFLEMKDAMSFERNQRALVSTYERRVKGWW